MNIDELLNTLAPQDSRPKAGALADQQPTTEEQLRQCLERKEQQLAEEHARLAAAGADYNGTGAWRGFMKKMGRTQ